MSVHTETNGPVTTIIMDRPEVRNAVDAATADALVAEFEAFNRDPHAKVAVFFGAHGTSFEPLRDVGRSMPIRHGSPLP